MIRSDYNIEIVADRYIYLIDLNAGGRSVTNDAENVVADLIAQFGSLKNKQIFYRDNMGQINEILVDNDRFAGFKANGFYRFYYKKLVKNAS